MRAFFRPSRSSIVAGALVLVLLSSSFLIGQNSGGTLLVMMNREVRRSIPITTAGGQEMVPLDDLAAAFQLTVRDDARALTISSNGRTVVLTPDQNMASVAGRLISLSAAPARFGGRWMVPLDFISRALVPIVESRLELRRSSRLLIVGDLRVPRVVIRSEVSGGTPRVVVDIVPRATAAVTQDGAQRLTLKIDADGLDLAPLPIQPGGPVQGVRSVDAATLAIDLAARIGSVRTQTQIVDAGARLLVDLAPVQTDSSPTAAPAVPPTTLADRSARRDGSPVLRTLVIDPGHGGEDIGAKGAAGTQEKDVTLTLAQQLKTAVEGRLGLRVIMTRDDDRSVSLTERAALANSSKADLFISLHANASFRSTVAGASIHTASFDAGAMDPAVAAIERLPTAGGGGPRDIELVPWNLAQTRHRARSDAFAQLLAGEYRDRVTLASRPTDHAPFRILESANMPAVLVEVGYLSNPDEEQQITSAERAGGLIDGLIAAIVKFRDSGAGLEDGR